MRHRDEIIELAAAILDPSGIHIEDANFAEFIRPSIQQIPANITAITQITYDMVKDAEPFTTVAEAFINFMQQQADTYSAAKGFPVEHLILVGHNGKSFDIPFFVRQLSANNMENAFFRDKRFGFGIDTLQVARRAIKENKSLDVPQSFQLGILYQYVSGREIQGWHRATADVKSTISILHFEHFWEIRKQCLFQFRGASDAGGGDKEVVDDSDSGMSEEDEVSVSSSSSSSSEEEADHGAPLGDRWEREAEYQPSVPTAQMFKEATTSVARNRRQRTGLLCNPISVNTPLRAWRSIFTDVLLNKIVKYTNEYGEMHAKQWKDITKKDLELFFAVLFISGIQKRKDKPSNWFSQNPLLESHAMKKVMSGRQFFTILRYLHCCSARNRNPMEANYDPSYKVTEIRDYLEERFLALFVPGQQLSLDETLIRAFGRIKFKVRIVTKAARYGIKVYVVTDATTAFVLKVVFYTGKSTYVGDTEEVSKKKTVQVVEQLVEPFRGTHRTIYVDRFYTSLELLKSLTERQLYITGTMLATRIPQAIRMTKTSAEYKQMKRGDAVKFKLRYGVDGNQHAAGLVAWRDRNVVYCLSNDSNNFEFDECKRRGDRGIISIPRPVSIANYNRYMGGVDLADMRRLQCNSTIMGQNRWWLKLFFYLLDVGTSNALVLHNEYRRMNQKGDEGSSQMNIVEFKKQLVADFLGREAMEELKGKGMAKGEGVEHVPVRVEGNTRYRCALCAMEEKDKRTRFKCALCGVPFCKVGNGRVENDCFTIAHKSEEILKYAKARHIAQQKFCRKAD
jgi:hypothetical protein